MSTVVGQEHVGLRIGPLDCRWSQRDVMLYALGIGARLPRDLAYVYEGGGTSGPQVTPTFALSMTTRLLEPLIARLGIDRRGLLHVGQSLTIDRVPPPHGSAAVTREVTAIEDKGRAWLVRCADTVRDGERRLARAESVWWIEKQPPEPAAAMASARGRSGRPAEDVGRPPDRTATEPTTTEQAALHRLSGDYNPVHIDPEMARSTGQPGPFLHGLATFGILGLTLERTAPANTRLTELGGRFTQPVFPGEPLEISVWDERPGEVRARVDTPRGTVLDAAAKYSAEQNVLR